MTLGNKDEVVTTVSIEEEVIVFVAEHIRVSRERLTLGTTLFGDLGVDGDGGVELLEAFMKRFRVDMQTYRGDQHFGPEGFVPWAPLYWLVLAWGSLVEKQSAPENRARLMPITRSQFVI